MKHADFLRMVGLFNSHLSPSNMVTLLIDAVETGGLWPQQAAGFRFRFESGLESTQPAASMLAKKLFCEVQYSPLFVCGDPESLLYFVHEKVT